MPHMSDEDIEEVKKSIVTLGDIYDILVDIRDTLKEVKQ